MTFARNKVTGSFICTLIDKDKAATHLKLIESLQMHDTIREITTRQLEKMVESALEKYINQIVQDSSASDDK